MAGAVIGRRVAILAADGVERGELDRPRQALDQAGGQTTLLSIHVVTDGNITTSRSPDDLPAFCDRILQQFASRTGG
jgi:putative intracellular protease/amidase